MSEPHRSSSSDSTPSPAALPAHVTTPLLTQITRQSLDQDYQLLADRRRADQAAALARGEEPGPAGHRRTSVGWVAAVVVFGLLIAVSSVQTSRNAPVEELGRGALVKRITDQREELAADQARIAKLRTRISDLQQRRSRIQGSREETAVSSASLQQVTGQAGIAGAGVVVELTDGPEADTQDSQLVRDEDIANVVNGLWEAGASAVSVNGVRLTTLSAIRNSDKVVRINRIAVTSPYAVQALGDPETLTQGFANSLSAQVATAFGDQLGFTLSIRSDAALEFPAAPTPALVAASTLGRTPTDKQRSQE